MTFMNPWLLLAAAGVALPILAHLLNRYQVKQTDWAAMQFLNRTVRVRSRQIRLRDILLLVLRCLAVLLLAFAFAGPAMKQAGGAASRFGERRAGVIIALDVSYSMQHSDGKATRFERAIEKIDTIAANIHPGDPVSMILLGDEHKVVMRNMIFSRERLDAVLRDQHPTPGSLNMDTVPQRLKELVGSMEALQKEIYIVTDLQEQDWKSPSAWQRDSFQELSKTASIFVVPVQGDSANLAITSLEMVSGVLRKGTVARYRATVHNFGQAPASNVRVHCLLDDASIDTKVIPQIAANSAETVSLFVSFNNAGSARITARLEEDPLLVDNSRRVVAMIRDKVSVLCVAGASDAGSGPGAFLTDALRASGSVAVRENYSVQAVPWLSLPSQDLSNFDVVILADVPDITPDQAQDFKKFVRQGNGLIWFAGDNVKPSVWNKRSALTAPPLLPAVIDSTEDTSDKLGAGSPLDPVLGDHPVCRPLKSLPEDLLSDTRFTKLLKVKPDPRSYAVLSLVGKDLPVVLGLPIGRGHVFMFTTSADPTWNNMALTPAFPMLVQQMITYMTGREFENPRMVGDALSLSYVDNPDASDAVFDTPAGRTVRVPVGEHRNQYVALLERAGEAGFYTARVSVQAPGKPVAVNVNTRESNVSCLDLADAGGKFDEMGITVARSDDELIADIETSRAGVVFSRHLILAGLVVLLAASLLADLLGRKKPRKTPSGQAGTPVEAN